MLEDAFFVNHLAHYLIRQQCDFRDLVRSAKSIEEMQKRNSRFERGSVRDQGEILCFLDRAEQSIAQPVARAAITSL